uniref:Microtubule-binding protein TANGLED n=1 Tax=Panagrellus redivivus TaxID=6233 RepID=A0A7E4ZSC2_PANRE
MSAILIRVKCLSFLTDINQGVKKEQRPFGMPPKRSTRSPSRSTSASRKPAAARKASPSPRKTATPIVTRSKSSGRGRKPAATPATPAVLDSSPEKSTPPARRTRSKSRPVVVPATAPPAPGRSSTRKTPASTPLRPIRADEDFAASSSRILKSLRSRRVAPVVDDFERVPSYNRSPVYSQSPAKPLPIAKRWLNKLPNFKLPACSTCAVVKPHLVKNWRTYLIFLTLLLMTWGYIANELFIRKKLNVLGESLTELFEEHRHKIQPSSSWTSYFSTG